MVHVWAGVRSSARTNEKKFTLEFLFNCYTGLQHAHHGWMAGTM